jgi:cell pole-organizing protein PopZ
MSSANPKIQEPSMEEILASIRRIIADDQDGARPAANMPAPEPSPESDDDVLDLADLSSPTSSAARLDLEHEDVSFRDSDGQIDFDAIPVDDEPIPAPAFFPEPEPRPTRAAEPPRNAPQGQDTLLSSAANATVSSAFNLLGSTVLTNNARTLEDLVKELLRPMLKGWLDENLPPLVERLVRAEIERVSRGGR